MASSANEAALRAKLAASEAARAASEAARAEAEAALAAEAARADASDARANTLARQLASFALVSHPDDGAAPLTIAAAPPLRASFVFPRVPLRSPTDRNAPCFLSSAFAALVSAPASLPAEPALAHTYAALVRAGGDARGMCSEGPFYALASSRLPPFAAAVGAAEGGMTAAALFTSAALRTAVWSFAGGCKPELHVRSRAGAAGEPPFRPAFCGELKSAGDGRALEQAAYYTAMDMVRIFFPAAADGAPCARRFFARPPLGYALVGFPHVAYYISLEWVGKLLVAPISAPFFLGSAAHEAAAAALPDVRDFGEPTELIDEALAWRTVEGAQRDCVAWVVAGGVFRKLVRGDARSGERFAAMARAYARLAEVLPDTRRPRALVPWARLLFGAHEVLVELPAVAGAREATEAEMAGSGGSIILQQVAAAVVWLAAHRLVYVDLRAPNVLVHTAACGGGAGAGTGGGDAALQATLVDYDDCVLTPEPVTSLAAFRAVLESTETPAAGCAEGGTFAASFIAGQQRAVEGALAAAFGGRSGESF